MSLGNIIIIITVFFYWVTFAYGQDIQIASFLMETRKKNNSSNQQNHLKSSEAGSEPLLQECKAQLRWRFVFLVWRQQSGSPRTYETWGTEPCSQPRWGAETATSGCCGAGSGRRMPGFLFLSEVRESKTELVASYLLPQYNNQDPNETENTETSDWPPLRVTSDYLRHC